MRRLHSFIVPILIVFFPCGAILGSSAQSDKERLEKMEVYEDDAGHFIATESGPVNQEFTFYYGDKLNWYKLPLTSNGLPKDPSITEEFRRQMDDPQASGKKSGWRIPSGDESKSIHVDCGDEKKSVYHPLSKDESDKIKENIHLIPKPRTPRILFKIEGTDEYVYQDIDKSQKTSDTIRTFKGKAGALKEVELKQSGQGVIKTSEGTIEYPVHWKNASLHSKKVKKVRTGPKFPEFTSSSGEKRAAQQIDLNKMANLESVIGKELFSQLNEAFQPTPCTPLLIDNSLPVNEETKGKGKFVQ